MDGPVVLPSSTYHPLGLLRHEVSACARSVHIHAFFTACMCRKCACLHPWVPIAMKRERLLSVVQEVVMLGCTTLHAATTLAMAELSCCRAAEMDRRLWLARNESFYWCWTTSLVTGTVL